MVGGYWVVGSGGGRFVEVRGGTGGSSGRREVVGGKRTECGWVRGKMGMPEGMGRKRAVKFTARMARTTARTARVARVTRIAC